MDSPGTMKGFIAAIGNGKVLARTDNDASAMGSSGFTGVISATGVVNDDVVAPSYREQTTREILLFVFG